MRQGKTSMRVGIIGTGAMGSLFAAHLADAGAEVWAFDVWREQIEAIRRDGLIVQRDGQSRSVRLHATSAPAEAGPCGAVMVFVKYGQTAQAIEAAGPMIGPATLVVTLQNGIGNVDIIRARYPDNPLAFGLTTLTCELTGPGRIEASYKGRGETWLWPDRGAPTPAMERLCATLTQGGIEAALSPEIALKIWKKLVVNCCLNTLCAIANQNVGDAVSDPAVWPFLDGVVEEIVAAAGLSGVPLRIDEARAFLRSVAGEARHHEPSMLIDIRNRRRTEIDCLNGAVLRICAQHGVAAPRNQALYALIRVIERGRCES
jgi:2-dehydropantoate 2-reductase